MYHNTHFSPNTILDKSGTNSPGILQTNKTMTPIKHAKAAVYTSLCPRELDLSIIAQKRQTETNYVSVLTCKRTILLLLLYNLYASSDIDQINHYQLLGKCIAIKLMVIAIHLVNSISRSLYNGIKIYM